MTKLRGELPHIFTAFFAGVSALAGLYAVTGFTRSFIITPINSFMLQFLPARSIANLLGGIVDPHQLALFGALSTGFGLLALAAFVGVKLGSLTRYPFLSPIFAGTLVWGVTALLTGALLISLGAAIPTLVVVFLLEIDWRKTSDADTPTTGSADTTQSPSRRKFLAALGGTLGFSVVSYWFGTGRTGNVESEAVGSSMDAQTLIDQSREKSFDVEGMSDLVSTFDEFYEVDINTVDPSLKADEWQLSITGEVENEVTVDYEELRSMENENRYVTLRCVGENLNGHKMNNAVWTGVPASKILERANPQGDYVMLRAADDYYEGFPLEALEEKGFIAYGMNGQTLPKGHGYPVRALVLGHWGEINVKWLTEIEILEEEEKGYWEKKGWHGTGPVNTVAKLWSDNKLDDGRFQVGGYAYAGIRGIEKVEISLDGGETWEEADLAYLDAEDAWTQWKYEWEPSRNKYEVVVRATDGKGDLQPEENQQPYPSGATGWVSKTVKVN